MNTKTFPRFICTSPLDATARGVKVPTRVISGLTFRKGTIVLTEKGSDTCRFLIEWDGESGDVWTPRLGTHQRWLRVYDAAKDSANQP